MSAPPPESRPTAPLSARLLAAAGAILAAFAVALSAYAAHAAADPHAQARLHSAAVFAFGHGIALAALAPQARRAFTRGVLGALLLGVLGFAGSLAAAHFFGASTRLAPYGGSLMILAWLAYAADAVRR
ncbi:hypothetical protein [Lysobacter enzymogenes]|uniref:hypothetical protein n=1 Tax=Lysobacter enzymogenes TaxID=69 RepID=UPI00099BD54C|nr:hypothetical protein [Lysobacter enzymogenes]QQP99817.1 DUF423 domain-containing protein [Lysobacter enzymogenes]UZW59261.1 DUF423 domain-containing protein [Lysobacter enzymogenes]